MSGDIAYKEVSINDLGKYLDKPQTTPSTPSPEKPEPQIGEMLVNGKEGYTPNYIPVTELIYTYKREGAIPDIPLSQYSLDDFKQMKAAGIELSVVYDGVECSLEQLINIWENENTRSTFETQQAIQSGNLLELDWRNRDNQYLFSTGITQSGIGTYAYVGHGDTSIGALVESPLSGSDSGEFDIGFKPKISLRQKLSEKTFASVDYNTNDSIWSVGAAYTPNNKDYISANVSTDANSIFSVKASFRF